MKKVTGLGGIFFKSQDPEKMKQWYRDHLGLATDQWGTVFEWRLPDDPLKKGYTQWSPFTANTEYFHPSEKEFMINYRVDDLALLLQELQQAGIHIIGEVQEFEYGKFAHIIDPEGNKIELWEPIDEVFDQVVDGRTK